VEKYFTKAPVELVDLLQQFQASLRLQSIKIHGTTWQYLIAGHSRHTLVLLPGEERYAEYWFQLVLAMQNNQQLLVVTLPAFDTIAAYTQGLAGLFDSLEMLEIDLLGSSLGGCIAQEFVRRYPHRVRRLVLANSYAPGCKHLLLSHYYAQFQSYIPASFLRILKKLHRSRVDPPAGRERTFWRGFNQLLFEQYLMGADKSTLLATLRALANFSTYKHYQPRDLVNWNGRLMIIESVNTAGSRDRCRSRLRSLYPQADVITLTSAGHTPGYSLPVDFSVLVGSFLQKS
jgi:pimeloyl-ACP methyl ester carboxylesterase